MPARALLMVEPSTFGYNAETASSNFFQQNSSAGDGLLRKNAIKEFEMLVEKIRFAGVTVFVKRHPIENILPDGVFPNNWISFLPGGTVVIYPMMNESRRKEKDKELIYEVATASGYKVNRVIDLSYFEKHGKFLEGTGSMVIDYANRISYASLSPRTSEEVFKVFCSETGYDGVVFQANDRTGRPVYHTNVILTITEKCAIICLEAVSDTNMRQLLLDRFSESGHMVIPISMYQVESFAGNMLEIANPEGKSFLVMSEAAFKSLTSQQLNILEERHMLIHSPIQTIETTGGGSVRCMMAEIF